MYVYMYVYIKLNVLVVHNVLVVFFRYILNKIEGHVCYNNLDNKHIYIFIYKEKYKILYLIYVFNIHTYVLYL